MRRDSGGRPLARITSMNAMTATIPTLDPAEYARIVFFTGAGMSTESGVPTYRGAGGIWHQYRWEDYACQRAFDADPALKTEVIYNRSVWQIKHILVK